MSDRPAGRPFERLIPLEPKAQLTSGSLVGTPHPFYRVWDQCRIIQVGTHCGKWRLVRAARGVSQNFHLLFLGNGWADCVEILYAIGVPLVTTYAVVTGGVSLHVRTCTPRFCISGTARPIGFNFGVWWGS